MRRIIGKGAKTFKKTAVEQDLLKYRNVTIANSIVEPTYGAVLLSQEYNYNRLTPKLINEAYHHLAAILMQ